jgi:hypothetical protein
VGVTVWLWNVGDMDARCSLFAMLTHCLRPMVLPGMVLCLLIGHIRLLLQVVLLTGSAALAADSMMAQSNYSAG